MGSASRATRFTPARLSEAREAASHVATISHRRCPDGDSLPHRISEHRHGHGVLLRSSASLLGIIGAVYPESRIVGRSRRRMGLWLLGCPDRRNVCTSLLGMDWWLGCRRSSRRSYWSAFGLALQTEDTCGLTKRSRQRRSARLVPLRGQRILFRRA
jgi:hypothetical protein